MAAKSGILENTMNQISLDTPLTRSAKFDWEKALYITLIILALATRLWGLGDRVQSHDESIHTKYSWDLYAGNGFQHQPLMHGPFLFHATALSYFFFGDNDYSARVPVALMGVILVAFPWLLRRWLGRAGALVTAFFFLISPSIAYYSRYIRHDVPIILWSMLVVWAIFSYLRDGRERWLYLMAAGVSLMFATKEVAFIYNAIFGFFLVILFITQAMRRGQSRSAESDKDESDELDDDELGLGLESSQLERTDIWRDLRNSRVLDLLIVLGTLCLPFLSPVLIQLVGLDPMDYNAPTLYYSAAITGAVVLISAGIGLWWNWQRWSIAAAIHYAIFLVLFTTIFSNGTGIASGLVGSLGYWLVQQEVQRGSQPGYYYVVMVLLYEYLPLLLALIAPTYLVIREVRTPSSSTSESSPKNQRLLFVLFLLWWTVTAWIGYSYAGERMPWLTVHLALPMLLLSGWLIGQLIESIDWQQVWKQRTWLLAFAAPPFVVALMLLLRTVFGGVFRGYEMEQLNATTQLLGGLVITAGFGAGLAYVARRSGWRTSVCILLLIALLVPVFVTARTAWRFCYVNYDYPTEFLVYAHAAPAVNEVMRQIDELSRRTAGGPNLIKVAYGAEASTLFYWQLRNYPNATFYSETPSREQMESPVVIAGRDQWNEVEPYMGTDYVVNTYIYMWWPMEDYRDLTLPRITHAITDTQTRAAWWDIWYNRDYSRYDELTGGHHTLDEWPLNSQFRLYVRRDLMAQLWEMGIAEPAEDLQLGPTDPYAEGWQELTARQVFGSQGTEPGQFEKPNGITIDADGFVYVVDTGNHRVQKFTADGQYIAWGEAGALQRFNEPWDISVAPSGDAYIADTWNHRVQKLDAEGNPVTAWGRFAQFGPGDGVEGEGAFYGPRGIAVASGGDDSDHLVYVADTGNKRVQVFGPDGQFAFQWGGGGLVDGYLDEPVGIATGPDGIYVADTWNRRVQVFDTNGQYVRQWPIVGWDAGQPDEKPYLAVDAQGYVYVTDPGHYRVLVFDSMGSYKLSFGQYGFDEQSFAFPTGIAVAEDGSIYVVDSHSARVLVFDALNLFDPAGAEP